MVLTLLVPFGLVRGVLIVRFALVLMPTVVLVRFSSITPLVIPALVRRRLLRRTVITTAILTVGSGLLLRRRRFSSRWRGRRDGTLLNRLTRGRRHRRRLWHVHRLWFWSDSDRLLDRLRVEV